MREKPFAKASNKYLNDKNIEKQKFNWFYIYAKSFFKNYEIFVWMSCKRFFVILFLDTKQTRNQSQQMCIIY